jgi:hypothetical protein
VSFALFGTVWTTCIFTVQPLSSIHENVSFLFSVYYDRPDTESSKVLRSSARVIDMAVKVTCKHCSMSFMSVITFY